MSGNDIKTLAGSSLAGSCAAQKRLRSKAEKKPQSASALG